MPLARIITESVDDSLELTMQLRARGFVVETVSPDQVPDTPADLEVRMEECSPEEVLNRAAGVSESEDLWVFVAPGALDERARPMRTIPLLPHAFDVPAPPMISTQFDTTWVMGTVAENDPSPLVAPLKAMPVRVADEIPLAPRNGGPKSEIAADLKKEPAPPVIVPNRLAKPAPDVQPGKVKMVVLPKLSEVPQIPEVPARAESMDLVAGPKAAAGRVRLRGPYKISFRTGTRFWKPIAVSAVLVVLAGLLVAAIALRPHFPPAVKPPTNAPAASAGVKPATSPKGSPVPSQVAAPAVSPVANRATSPVTTPAVPPIAAKPVTDSPKAVSVKNSSETAQNPPAKPAAASAVVNSPNKAQPVRRHTGSSEADIVAEDTVVFYNHKPASPVAKTPQESGGKQ